MSTPDLDRLIIESILDLDGAAQRIGEIESTIWQAIAGIMKGWADEHGWTGTFDIHRDLEVWPPHWGRDRTKLAQFGVGWGPGDSEGMGTDGAVHFDLTRLSGAGAGRLCLWFGHDAYRNRWKPVAKASAETVRPFDFSITDYANFYTDCTPVQAAMAEAVENGQAAAALGALRSALDRAKAAEPAFTEMLRRSDVLPR